MQTNLGRVGGVEAGVLLVCLGCSYSVYLSFFSG